MKKKLLIIQALFFVSAIAVIAFTSFRQGTEIVVITKEQLDLGPTNDLFAAADPNYGKLLAIGCTACHSLQKGEPNKIGPNLYGIVGAKIASNKTYDYSEALKNMSEKNWTIDALYMWLRDPMTYAPGTKMPFGGILDPQDRMDLIAYLYSLTQVAQSEAQ